MNKKIFTAPSLYKDAMYSSQNANDDSLDFTFIERVEL